METKDRKEIKKLLENNPESLHPDRPADPYSDQTAGIVRIQRRANESEEEFHTLQEQHNANHALYYFSMITDGIVRGKTTGDDREKIRRIKEHMMTLREFVSEDKAELKAVINSLLERLEKSSPVRRKQFAKFIYENWSLILPFAEAYGHQERCFPKVKYHRLRDIVLGRCYFKLWWWELRFTRLVKSLRHSINSPLSKLPLKEDRSSALFNAFLNNKMTIVIQILTSPKVKGEPAIIERAIHSIEDIFHHFCPKDNRLADLFEELIALLKKCPDLTEEDSRKGSNIVEELLKAFGCRPKVRDSDGKNGTNRE